MALTASVKPSPLIAACRVPDASQCETDVQRILRSAKYSGLGGSVTSFRSPAMGSGMLFSCFPSVAAMPLGDMFTPCNTGRVSSSLADCNAISMKPAKPVGSVVVSAPSGIASVSMTPMAGIATASESPERTVSPEAHDSSVMSSVCSPSTAALRRSRSTAHWPFPHGGSALTVMVSCVLSSRPVNESDWPSALTRTHGSFCGILENGDSASRSVCFVVWIFIVCAPYWVRSLILDSMAMSTTHPARMANPCSNRYDSDSMRAVAASIVTIIAASGGGRGSLIGVHPPCPPLSPLSCRMASGADSSAFAFGLNPTRHAR